MQVAVENCGVTPYCTKVRQKLVRLLGFRHVVAVTTDFAMAARLRFQPQSKPVVATQRRSAMENKPAAQNIQDTFLNTARKERSSITIYLMSGVKLTGRIRSFDKYSVVLETNNQEQLIFKHAISTVAVGKAHGYSEKPRVVPSPTTNDSGETPAASGTEG